MRWEEIFSFVLVVLISYFVFSVGFGNWRERKSCREQIVGICLEKTLFKDSVTGHICSRIRFSYHYNGKKYAHYSLEEFGNKKLAAFQEGEEYSIYVNPKKPKKIRCTGQMVTVTDIFCIVWGGGFLSAMLLALLADLLMRVFR